MFKLSYDELNMMSLDWGSGGEEGELKDQPRLINNNMKFDFFVLCLA